MKRIAGLCVCILLVLLVCFTDGYFQRKRIREAVSGGVQKIMPAVRTEREANTVRVLIKTADYASNYHAAVTISSEKGFQVRGESERAVLGGQEETFFESSSDFGTGDVLKLSAEDGKFQIRALGRARESEVYEGELELRKTDEGLLLINELLLEDYLCGVVPSEMPSSYPAEALKVQAICARTYVKKRMQESGELFADVDDSVSYQVYNNQDRTEETDKAVRETAGMVLTDGRELIDALYYSTSCGLDAGLDLSQEAVFAALLSKDPQTAYEAGEPWYRWQTDILLENLAGTADFCIESRLKSGAVDRILVTGPDGEQRAVEGEYQVREFLAGAAPAILRQDGVTVDQPALLPSAFFVMQPLMEGEYLRGYHLVGGGYGHGIGMSQNGAKHMALAGADYREILQYYYRGSVIQGG